MAWVGVLRKVGETSGNFTLSGESGNPAHCYVTVLMFQISYGLLQFDYFVCPIDYDEVKGALSMECERSFAFRLHDYSVPWFIHRIGALVSSFDFNNSCSECTDFVEYTLKNVVSMHRIHFAGYKNATTILWPLSKSMLC